MLLAACRAADMPQSESRTTQAAPLIRFTKPVDVDAEVKKVLGMPSTAPDKKEADWVDTDSLWIEPILVAYETPTDRLRALAAEVSMCLRREDHPLSQRRIDGILLALELVPWMSRDEQAALESRLQDVLSAGVPRNGRLAQRRMALQVWAKWCYADKPISTLLDALESEPNVTRVTASHVLRWATSTTDDPRALVDWIARVDYGEKFAAHLPGRQVAVSSDNVVRDFALAQAWCCKRMKSIPATAARGYEALAGGRGTAGWYVAFDSLSAAAEFPDDLAARSMDLMCQRPCETGLAVGLAARALTAFEESLRGSARADVASWLDSEASRLRKEMLSTDVAYAKMVVERLKSGP